MPTRRAPCGDNIRDVGDKGSVSCKQCTYSVISAHAERLWRGIPLSFECLQEEISRAERVVQYQCGTLGYDLQGKEVVLPYFFSRCAYQCPRNGVAGCVFFFIFVAENDTSAAILLYTTTISATVLKAVKTVHK